MFEKEIASLRFVANVSRARRVEPAEPPAVARPAPAHVPDEAVMNTRCIVELDAGERTLLQELTSADTPGIRIGSLAPVTGYVWPVDQRDALKSAWSAEAMRQAGWMKWMAAAAVCVAAPEVHAYLDPGAGSMLLQILLGGLAGLGVLGRLYWHRIRKLVGAQDADDREREEKQAGPKEE